MNNCNKRGNKRKREKESLGDTVKFTMIKKINKNDTLEVTMINKLNIYIFFTHDTLMHTYASGIILAIESSLNRTGFQNTTIIFLDIE